MLTEIAALLRKEILLEWRNKYAFNGVVLYLAATIFSCYLSFNLQRAAFSPLTWNALFWIILLFTATNAVAKSFLQEPAGRFYYYYTLARAEAIILAKIIYNTLFMWLMALLGYAAYAVVLGNPVQDQPLFLANLALGGLGFASALTMISGIAAKAGNGGTLMAVLGFPVVLPMLLLLLRVSRNAIDGLARSVSYDELLTLGAINVIVLAVTYLLFPFLWRS
ncbi:MAG: heme exporter protein CcmB [Bernardetiaceae bacterium]|nr:heme exporter protein CcmB [Bernardetiaceae bacterium]